MILIILSVNIKCFKLIIKSFEFWFKMFYFVQYCVAQWIYYYILIDSHEWDFYTIDSKSNVQTYNLEIFTFTLSTIRTLLGGLIFISLDALQIKLWIKTFFGIAAAGLLTFNAIRYTFFADLYGVDNSIIHVKALNLSISLTSIMGNALQILSIFVWKQVILSILRKNRCILVKYSPYIGGKLTMN